MIIKPTATPLFSWPMRILPAVVNAGSFPLNERHFLYRYLGATHALHLHEYDGVVKIGPSEFPLAPGVITFSPAGLPSRYHLPQPGKHWCIHFTPAPQRPKSTASINFPLAFPLHGQHGFAVERFKHISRLFSRAKNGDSLADASASAALQEYLLWLHTAATASADERLGKSERTIDRVVALLQSHLDQPLDVEALADTVELTQDYLARRFKQRFNVTIPRYLLLLRLDHAKLLLQTTDMPIHRVAQHVGLPNAQHFNKQFRRLIGASPSAFRTRERKP